MNWIINVELKGRTSSLIKTQSLYRSDVGTVLRITGTGLIEDVEIEFRTYNSESAIVRTLRADDTVEIPHALFKTKSGQILVHVVGWDYEVDWRKKILLCRLIIPIREGGD